MTDQELVAAFGDLRVLCLNVVGFHIEAERESNQLTGAQRVMYEAQVYASGVELAHRVIRIADALENRQTG